MERPLSSLRQLDHHIDSTIRMYPNDQTDDYPQHWHTTFELIMPVENEYMVYTGEQDHRLLPGDILIIPSGVVHEIYAPESGLRYIVMVDQNEVYAVEGITAVLSAFYPCVHLTPHDGELYEQASELFRAVVKEFRRKDYFSLAMLRSLLGALFVLVGRGQLRSQQTGSAPTTLRQHQITALYLDVCSYITEHCHEKLSLEEMASYIGYSKYHFARMFKRFSGMSFYDYYIEQRLLLCERLLTNPNLSVTEAAMRSGFGSIATFNRIFKERKGVTPSQYRHMLQMLYTGGEHTKTPAFEKQAAFPD